MRSLVAYGFLAPPNVFIVIGLLGALIALIWRRAGLALVLLNSLCLFITATPAFSSYLETRLESQIPKSADLSSAQAILVFGADVRDDAPNTLGPQSIERLIMVADAYHRLHLPVAVSGGRIEGSETSVARLMKSALKQYFAVPVAWSEDQSRNTFENAAYTERLLRKAKIGTVVLVTQARDLPRAIWSCKRVGLRAVPWTAPRAALQIEQVKDFLPSAKAFEASFYAIHELLGTLYYRARY